MAAELVPTTPGTQARCGVGQALRECGGRICAWRWCRVSAAIVAMNATDARALTDRIKVGVEAIWELIKQAYTERAWAALGYESWDDYCTREFGTARLRLPREERAEVVASLRESGLSQRAIASATGLSQDTVRRDLSAGERFRSPEPEPEPVDEVDEDGLTEELIEAELPPLPEGYMNLPPQPAPAPKPIIGIDGKTYNPKPATPKEPRRKPITDAFDSANLRCDFCRGWGWGAGVVTAAVHR